MPVEIFIIPVILLAFLAVFDLVVGVSNDAVNFLTSSIGSKVASRKVILIVASLGILAGVTFSSGMMEVARKGIFNPQYFTMPDLITIFLAVMIVDVILLDLFNSLGLPTSTTVSIVFELLGAAVGVSVIKIYLAGDSFSQLAETINTSKALMIIFGILFSVVVAFFFGAVIQFLSRLLFTFDFTKRLKAFGALWGGIAMAAITFFILVKGAKGSSFMTAETVAWIKGHSFQLLLYIFILSAIVLQVMIFLKRNILKPIILVGTFALAMAFAANDLVNFIGVPMAGFHSFKLASSMPDPLTASMAGLAKKVPSETFLLLLAGAIMVITLWKSKKSQTVTATSLDLGQQEEGIEKFGSSFMSRNLVRMFLNLSDALKKIFPESVRNWVASRMDTSQFDSSKSKKNQPSFDQIRAAVNLMVAGAVISYATSKKLPLSTTYVTFMVAMGTSFADRAWGRESAVYRITGVLTVIGGWFMTAILAFTFACILALILFITQMWGVIFFIGLAGFIVWKSHLYHKKRSANSEREEVFNLKKVEDIQSTLEDTMNQVKLLLVEIRESIDATMDALFSEKVSILIEEKRKNDKIQRWSNITIANIFKSLRLLQKKQVQMSFKYGQIIRRLQRLADGHRDITLRAYEHVSNHHKGLVPEQVEQLKKVKEALSKLFDETEKALGQFGKSKQTLEEHYSVLNKMGKDFHQEQILRIADGTSKTRLSILFYAIIGNSIMLAKQNVKILEIFDESTHSADEIGEFELD